MPPKVHEFWYGIACDPSRRQANITGTSLSNSLFGLRVEDRGDVSIGDSSVANNVNFGLSAVSALVAAQINATDVLLSGNDGGAVGANGPQAFVRIANIAMFGNAVGIAVVGGGAVVSTTPATNVNAGNTAPGAPTSSVALQ